MYPDVDPTVHVYAEEGPDLADYLQKIDGYNARTEDPDGMAHRVYSGSDFVERFVAERAGDVVVIAGNNRRKTEYVNRAIEAGMHVLADKPMAIDGAGYESLRTPSPSGRKGRAALRHHDRAPRDHHDAAGGILAPSFGVRRPAGRVGAGTGRRQGKRPSFLEARVGRADQAAGVVLRRDATGGRLVDITTHLVDLVQWECFPSAILDYAPDIELVGAKRWPTVVSPAQFAQVTQLQRFPEFLRKDVHRDGSLHVYANGEIDYRLKGVHAKVRVLWNFEAPPNAGDTHYSVMRGSKANLVIRQGAAEAYRPALYIEPVLNAVASEFVGAMQGALSVLRATYPGIDAQPAGDVWQVLVPESYHVGHEAHFGQVATQFLAYVERGALPDWEVPNMIAKYATTTRALEVARGAAASPA